MKNKPLTILIIVIFGTIAIFTNPDQDRHQEVIKNKIYDQLQQKINENLDTSSELGKAGRALGTMVSGALVDRIVEQQISADNYVLFSITKLKWDNEVKVVGFGMFGNVLLTKELDEAISERLDSVGQFNLN